MKKILLSMLSCLLAAGLTASVSAAVIPDGYDRYGDYTQVAVNQTNNIDVAFHKNGGFSNGATAVTLPQSSPVEITSRKNRLRGWSVCSEGIEAYYYQLDQLRSDGNVRPGTPVYFEAETREDVLEAHPEYESVNPDAKVGIDIYIPTASLSVATYRIQVYALTKQQHKYMVFSAYIYLETDFDANEDGLLDVRDAIMYRRMMDEQEYNFSAKWDFNGNGKYDEYDYTQLLAAIASRNE